MTSFHYDLNHPDNSYSLPDPYKEISGLSPLEGNNCLAFVQDEAVQIHLFDLASATITELAKHGDGDSEDLAVIGTTAYVLKSGKQPAIYQVCDFQSDHALFKQFDLALEKEQDPEGLCHDASRNRLLIACKGPSTRNDSTRGIYAFNLQTMEMDPTPAYIIDSRDFLDDPEETFNPSGIAIHPRSNDLYVIGSKGEKMIVCYGMDGCFKEALRLDKDQFMQPEGITFLSTGELVISSEGKKGKKAEILTFALSQQS
jgi:uncharacterized protein YjiK